jgi:glycosyltransferase involved in cell wall biosynthesis
MSRDSCVSVVVPVQDEERTIEVLLNSVDSQSLLPQEVVLVDAGSRDRTVALAKEHRGHVPIRILPAGRVFPGIARNLGVSAASGDWIAFTDGGIALEPDWLQELMSAAGEEADVVFGGMDPDCDSFFRQCAALAYVSPRDEHGIRGPFIASSLMRRSRFLSVGGFPDFRAAEDLILVERLQAAGATVKYAPGAHVRWQIPGTFGTTFGRFANYSHHNLVAARGTHWHLGVARLYLLLGLGAIALCSVGATLLAGLAIPGFFAARAAKAAWVKRHSFSFSTLHPARVLWAAVILMIIDAATAVGAVRWLRAKILD